MSKPQGHMERTERIRTAMAWRVRPAGTGTVQGETPILARIGINLDRYSVPDPTREIEHATTSAHDTTTATKTLSGLEDSQVGRMACPTQTYVLNDGSNGRF